MTVRAALALLLAPLVLPAAAATGAAGERRSTSAPPVNTRRLRDGVYTLAVRASDICGNSSSLSVPVRVENGQPVLRSAAAIPAIERRSGAAASSSPER